MAALDKLPKQASTLKIQAHWRGHLLRTQGIESKSKSRLANLRSRLGP